MPISYTSPVKAIRNIDFHKLPNNTTRRISKIAVMNTVMIAMAHNGKLYTNGNSTKNALYIDGWGEVAIDRIKCLHQLGYITRDELNTHVKYMEQEKHKHDLKYDLGSMERIAERHGFNITKSQLKKLT